MVGYPDFVSVEDCICERKDSVSSYFIIPETLEAKHKPFFTSRVFCALVTLNKHFQSFL